MKVGDLVTLSARGEKSKWLSALRDEVGIVLDSVYTTFNSTRTHNVSFTNGITIRLARNEIKYAK